MQKLLIGLLLVVAYCAPLRAQISATQIESLVAVSTVSAGVLVGDGYNISGGTIGTSSTSAGPFNIASLTYVDIATATLSLRGSRVGAAIYTVRLDNQSANQRDYTLQLVVNGVTVDEFPTTIRANDYGQAGDMFLLAPSPSGETNIAINVKANGTAGTQLANDAKIRMIEWP